MLRNGMFIGSYGSSKIKECFEELSINSPQLNKLTIPA